MMKSSKRVCYIMDKRKRRTRQELEQETHQESLAQLLHMMQDFAPIVFLTQVDP